MELKFECESGHEFWGVDPIRCPKCCASYNNIWVNLESGAYPYTDFLWFGTIERGFNNIGNNRLINFGRISTINASSSFPFVVVNDFVVFKNSERELGLGFLYTLKQSDMLSDGIVKTHNLTALIGSIGGIFYIPPYIVILDSSGGGIFYKLSDLTRLIFEKSYSPEAYTIPQTVPPIRISNNSVSVVYLKNNFRYQLFFISDTNKVVALDFYSEPNPRVKSIEITDGIVTGIDIIDDNVVINSNSVNRINLETGEQTPTNFNFGEILSTVYLRSTVFPNKIFGITFNGISHI